MSRIAIGYLIILEYKRLFIAAELPVTARETVYQLGSRVLNNCDGGIAVKAVNMHITLKFLASVSEDNLDIISDGINNGASTFNSFSFEIDGKIDAFPNKKRARTVFSTIGEGKHELKLLHLSIEESLGRVSKQFRVWAAPNDFIAHITIARLRHPGDITYAINEAGTILPIRVECKSIALFESMLEPTGVRYTKLREFSLK